MKRIIMQVKLINGKKLYKTEIINGVSKKRLPFKHGSRVFLFDGDKLKKYCRIIKNEWFWEFKD